MQSIGMITNTADANNEFTDGDGASGIESTLIPSAWLNVIQRELIAVIEAAGLTPDATNDKQLLTALQTLFSAKTS